MRVYPLKNYGNHVIFGISHNFCQNGYPISKSL